MKQMGFKSKIITGTLILLVMSLMITNGFSFLTFKETKVQDINHLASLKIEKAVELLEADFATKTGILENTIPYIERLETDEDIIELLQTVATIADIDAMFVGYENGKAFSSLHGRIDGPTYNPKTRGWYKLARAENRTVVTDVYPDAISGKLIVSIAAPIENGAILIDVFLTNLQGIVDNLTDNTSVAGIYDDKGRVIVSTGEADKAGQRLSDYHEFVGLEKELLTNKQGTYQFNFQDTKKTAEFMEIQIGANKTWHILIAMNESIAYKEVTALQVKTLVISVVSILLSVALLVGLLNFLYRPVIQLKDTIIGLSQGDGDLTQRLEVTSNDELGQMAYGVNAFIANLQKIMLEIKDVSNYLSDNATVLKENAEQNTSILAQHVLETAQVVAAVEEMNATAVEVASNAARTAVYTQEADVMAQDTLDIVNQAKVSISHLVNNAIETEVNVQKMSVETKSINSILNIIGDIAEQTNLLALNAAIEAARAGEQGRGFAVVADEVRNLASRTKMSTTEIEDALQRLLQGNETVVSSIAKTKIMSEETAIGAEQCGVSLESMSERVSDINSLNTQVATAAEEQSSVTQELTRNLVTISDMVTEVDERVNKTAVRAESISSVNSQLSAIVKKFKLQ